MELLVKAVQMGVGTYAVAYEGGDNAIGHVTKPQVHFHTLWTSFHADYPKWLPIHVTNIDLILLIQAKNLILDTIDGHRLLLSSAMPRLQICLLPQLLCAQTCLSMLHRSGNETSKHMNQCLDFTWTSRNT